MAKLGDVCTIVSGTTPKTSVSEYWDGNINWITPAELNEDTVVINESKRKITKAGVNSCGLSPFPAGTVILSSRAPIGKTAIAGTEMYCNQGLKNLICSDKIHNKYLFWFLRSKTEMLNSLGRGATFKEISKSIVENIEIPLPDLPTQQRIADTLDKVSEGIGLCRKMLGELDLMVKSRFMEMFGEPVNNPMGWPIKKLNSVISSITAGWSANGEARQKRAGEKAVLKVSAVTQGFFKPNEHKALPYDVAIKKYIYPQKGDLLFSRANTRELVGATAIIEQDYPELLLPDKLWKILFTSEIDVYYAKYILSSEPIRKIFSAQSTGTSGSMYNVSADKFRDISIPVPPIANQHQFAAFVQQTSKSKLTIQKILDKMELEKLALMQKYFA